MRGLPSFNFLVTCVSMLLLIPLCTFGVLRWQAATDQFQAALTVERRSEQLNTLLQLAPALNQERRIALWTGEGARVLRSVPGGAGVLIPDFDPTREADIAEVDQLVAALGNSEVRATVAEAAAAVQVIAAGTDTRWAQLEASALFPTVLEDTIGFARSVSVLEERIAVLERVASPETPVGARWKDLASSRSALQLRQNYREVVRQFAITGIDPTQDRGDPQLLEANDVSVEQSQRLSTGIREGLDHAQVFSAGVAEVVELSLAEVDAAAARFVALILGAGLALLFTVGRPVRRMAYSAQRLSQGHLDTVLPEFGPTEVRLGARALNEALGSIQIAEEQAVALAEERLDDASLKKRAPGELGKSLQVAVNRLARSITERENFQRQLEHDAAHDHLTKLANRASVLGHLRSAVARCGRNGGTLALLFIDIDDFKSINDTHGHHTGDEVLQTVATRVSAAIREGDLAGRLGGDEFVVVAEPIRDIEGAVQLGQRVIAEASKPITVEGVTFHPSLSIGVAIAEGTSNVTADELLRDADNAVYRAKSQGKSCVEVCDDVLRQELRERKSLEKAIRRAIDSNELVLHFQPCVSAIGREIVGVEALVRWQKPNGELVFPDEFIPAAERTDLILDLDRWVLRAAIGQVALWHDEPSMRPLSVAVNVSARHLGSGTLCTDVLEATSAYDVLPSTLILELTETAVLEDLEVAARELATLRGLGIRIALDDYGTGFMSLAHLRQLPVDILKIDRSLVAEIGSATGHSLVQLIADTGHLLGVSITGEGVETADQAHVLQLMGVDDLQGYFFGRPVDAQAIASHQAMAKVA